LHSLGVSFKAGTPQNTKIEKTMKKIYIHIGMHRTGTSTFQKFLELNAEKLNAKNIGVFMPSQHGIANSSEYFMMEARSRAQEYADLKKFLEQSYDAYIISAEELSRFGDEAISSLKSVLDSHHDKKIEIIACIRQPNQYVDSAGAKLVENSGFTLESLLSSDGLVPLYSRIVDWDAAFEGCLKIFDFADDSLTPILEMMGIADEEYYRPPKENASKCLEFIVIKASLNDPRYVQAQQFLGVVSRGLGTRKFILPQEVAMSIGVEVNRQVKIFNAAFGSRLDFLNIYGRPKISEYSNTQFLARCIVYLFEHIISAIPAILTSGGLAYSNHETIMDGGFDPFGYLLSNLDLCANSVNPYEHYKSHGKSEGRIFFDSKIIDQIKGLE